MPKYRKKPVVIEAHQWFENGDHPEDHPPDQAHWPDKEGEVVRRFRRPDVQGSDRCGQCGHLMDDHGWIDTMEGGHTVCPGDYIITGVRGERYPCKPDVFEQTYEPVPETAEAS